MLSYNPFIHLLNLLAPPHCVACKRFLDEQDVLCAVCYRLIQPVVSKTINLTLTREMKVLSVGAYAPPLQSLILAKARSDKTMSVMLGNLIWQKSFVRNVPFDYIVPVPLHWTRYAWRGYNQAEVIARVLSEKSGKPMVHLLKRNRYTPFLSKVRFIERGGLMKEIFSINDGLGDFKEKHILLVDDVMTTGVTLKTAGRELLYLSPSQITAVVAARVT